VATPTHITTSGGLISAAFIENIRELGTRQRGIEPESFALPWNPAPKSSAALEETIASAWELLEERWDAVRAGLPMVDVSQVRSRWLLPLFQLLDFEPVYLRGDTVPSTALGAGLDEAGQLRYPLSHRGWQGEGAPVLHTVGPSQDLDARMATGRGIKAKSPHDMLQAFLNASRTDQWTILTNGIILRLLRDYHHTFTKGFVQFDLESIFETRNYGDFRALYRLCHASRFIVPPSPEIGRGDGGEGLSPLEQFYKDSLATGIKVGEDLREQVRQVIETLGNGFLDGELIRQLQAGPAHCRRYYGEILHIVYRILFLLFAEQRGMLPHTGAPLEDLYRTQYSITALRTRAEGDIPRQDDFTDLWEGLRVTFRMVREGVPELGVFGYDGMLFEDNGTIVGARHSKPNGSGDDEGSSPNASPLRGRACRNSDLLHAIRALTLVEREGVLQRISYADLGVEELGSIYESLLDFTPRISTVPENVTGRDVPANTFFLDPRGAERKTTGSYYTHPSLVNELIKSALLPVARDRLARAGLPVVDEDAIGEATAGLLADYAGLTDAQRAAGEAALLGLKVCDPAAGSGHFLVKADNALGAELARIRTGDEYPTENQMQAARRDVLAHCLYAVDVNPMAVELCKVSLWINASVQDKPLSFLDHHIKCGNSLIGATPELMAQGIPTDAFQAVTGDHRPTVNAVRRRNRAEREQEEAGAIQQNLWRVTLIETPEDLARWRRLTLLAEEQPQQAREAYGEYTTSRDYQRKKLEADFWTAAFFWPLTEQTPGFSEELSVSTGFFPTHGEFRRLCTEGPAALPPEALEQTEALAEGYRFFHWHLEFPDVFDPHPGLRPPLSLIGRGDGGEGGSGFDVVLGNPPWERIKLQEKEFFATRDPEIANAPTAAARGKLIARLAKTNPTLAAEYAAALRQSETTGHFLRDSGRFPLTSGGDINTYAVFAGLARQVIAPNGRAGIVVPTGIATDYTYRDFFVDVVESEQLASLYDFENREGLFPGTHRSYKFSLLTLTGDGAPEADFAFFLHTAGDLADPERRFILRSADLTLLNPNTRTCPVFRTRRDADLTRELYRVAPVLVNHQKGENPWRVFLGIMFHSGGASGLFQSYQELAHHGLVLTFDNRFEGDSGTYLPLYEGKMFMQYDHRAAGVRLFHNPGRAGLAP
jgi:hypothetical protein